jgi:hypothetical protein
MYADLRFGIVAQISIYGKKFKISNFFATNWEDGSASTWKHLAGNLQWLRKGNRAISRTGMTIEITKSLDRQGNRKRPNCSFHHDRIGTPQSYQRSKDKM